MDESSPNIHRMLRAEDLLAGSTAVLTIQVPLAVLNPTAASEARPIDGPQSVRIRPINIATLSLISRAARDDASLIPLLMIKEGLVEPALTLDQIRQLHIGLIHFLVSQINLVSGLSADGSALADATITQTLESPMGQIHLLLARHFGWTPEQVGQLTPGQVAVYLAGIERLTKLEQSSS